MEFLHRREIKKTRSVWFLGCCFAFMLFVAPFFMLEKHEGKWKFVEKIEMGDVRVSFIWLFFIFSLMFFIFSLIWFIVGIIRTRFHFERIRHEELGFYEICYAFSWMILLMVIISAFNMADYFAESAFLLIPLLLFRKNLSLIGIGKLAFTWRIIGVILLCYGVGYLVDTGFVWLMNSAFSIDMYSAREEEIVITLQGYFQNRQWFSLIGEMLAISLVGPLWEEVLFRGLVQTYFMRKFPTSLAVIISSLLFAMAHGDPTLALPLFVSGLFLGGLYAYTKSLWPPIVLHILNNTVCTILIVLNKY